MVSAKENKERKNKVRQRKLLSVHIIIIPFR